MAQATKNSLEPCTQHQHQKFCEDPNTITREKDRDRQVSFQREKVRVILEKKGRSLFGFVWVKGLSWIYIIIIIVVECQGLQSYKDDAYRTWKWLRKMVMDDATEVNSCGSAKALNNRMLKNLFQVCKGFERFVVIRSIVV